MNKADQMINRIHNLNLIISKEEKAVRLRARRLHFIKNNYIPTDQDLHSQPSQQTQFYISCHFSHFTNKVVGDSHRQKALGMGVNRF